MNIVDVIVTTTLCIVMLVLVYAAFNDIKHRRIPNSLSLVLIVLYGTFALATQFQDSTTPVDFINGLLTGIGVLAGGLVLFGLGVMGGGDIKLAAALSLFAGTPYLPAVLILITLSGGILAGATWGYSKLKPKQNKVDGANRDSVPYGVAISISGVWLCIQLLKVDVLL